MSSYTFLSCRKSDTFAELLGRFRQARRCRDRAEFRFDSYFLDAYFRLTHDEQRSVLTALGESGLTRLVLGGMERSSLQNMSQTAAVTKRRDAFRNLCRVLRSMETIVAVTVRYNDEEAEAFGLAIGNLRKMEHLIIESAEIAFESVMAFVPGLQAHQSLETIRLEAPPQTLLPALLPVLANVPSLKRIELSKKKE